MRLIELVSVLSSVALFACSSSTGDGGGSPLVDAARFDTASGGDSAGDGGAGSSDTGAGSKGDARSGDSGGGGDTGGGAGDDAGACTIESDPCYKEAVAAYAGSVSCFDHTNTCDGNDPSGCGASTDKGATCKWTDGTEEDTTTDATSGITTIIDKGVGGKECSRYVLSGTSADFTQKLTIDSKTYTLQAKSDASGATTYTLTCPSGSSVTFTDADAAGCTQPLSGNTCCTTTTPPTCPTGT